ncbi:bifunctional pyr operon transcriptional regulator/uracil phosphoribosyltransferase PyrR [Synechococcus sp. Nb3U1]|uniref:bifunctional pyr operon transcriptional regulator/uracil phosphoribosyltransferase PyrR n=1 Tax=Synechococcus sp. Nb3U1 TaxID=1914529 RepID=UPI001F27BBC5|nr:bifunctional pyr operon transcriptional regulator/uracil phosphoribosyltransferase PyrR [Synechococcus sp. Nb3U1]MCF2970065.1 bifunctional pyr operon transcriptional regulator/uracil phosphoribosyltransferase PyrR [Synechococcus sp. Nb3U1]
MSKVEILDANHLAQLIAQLADEIGADHPHLERLALIGIRTRGVPLAYRLRDQMAARFGIPPQVGELDITFFRDDLGSGGLRTPDRSEMPRDLTGKEVVLVDDVIFRGRTIRAALEALNHFGRPERVRLAVLIDRGHRQFPIQPDYCGQQLSTEPEQIVRVHLLETDAEERVLLCAPDQENSHSYA